MVKEIEIYENKKLVTVVESFDRLQDYLKKRENELYKNGFKRVEKHNYYRMLANLKEQVAMFITYRFWYGFYDINGERIYEGDRLIDKNGKWIEINEDYIGDDLFYTYDGENVSDRKTRKEIEDIIKGLKIRVTESIFKHL